MKGERQQVIFTKNLNKFIARSGKTQKEIADDLGVSPQVLNSWCQGISTPRMGKIQLLADYFNTTKSSLIDEQEPQTKVSSLETLLASTMSELNEEGREKVLEYAKYLVFTGEYKKQDFRQMVVQEVC